MVLGPTAGEQYLHFIGFPHDYYPNNRGLLNDLDDAILSAVEEVLAEHGRRDPLLRALLHDDCALNTWATYPAGDLPPGTDIQVTNSYGRWEGRTTGETRNPYGTEHLRITWTVYPVNQFGAEPTIDADTDVSAWVPLPCDLSAVLAAIDGYPATVLPATTSPRPGRLSPNMLELLTDLAIHPQMFITQCSPWDRTAQALIRRGLAYAPRGAHARRYELRITVEGRVEAIRRGIITPATATAA
jgi:hypothetical protein